MVLTVAFIFFNTISKKIYELLFVNFCFFFNKYLRIITVHFNILEHYFLNIN